MSLFSIILSQENSNYDSLHGRELSIPLTNVYFVYYFHQAGL